MDEKYSNPHLQRAVEILSSVQGRETNLDIHKQKSIDLVSQILTAALKKIKKKQLRRYQEIQRILDDPQGKALISSFIDQIFRVKSTKKTAERLLHLIDTHGIPGYLRLSNRLTLHAFHLLAGRFHSKAIPWMRSYLQNLLEKIVVPSQAKNFNKTLESFKSLGFKIHVLRLKDQAIHEKETVEFIEHSAQDMQNPLIDCLFIKISSLSSQINLTAYADTLHALCEKIRRLLRENLSKASKKTIILDMESFELCHLTVDVFIKVFSEKEFLPFVAGITLQAYLPQSYELQQRLSAWALWRREAGGAAVILRIVKGSYLALELVKASINMLKQAPYKTKQETDANFKRMIQYGMADERTRHLHLQIATHNLFDLTFALILAKQYGITEELTLEMSAFIPLKTLETIKKISPNFALYFPTTYQNRYEEAIPFIFSKLNEIGGKENFLRHFFTLQPYNKEWDDRVASFSESCDLSTDLYHQSRRTQNRSLQPTTAEIDYHHFANEEKTDFSLPQNQHWAEKIYSKQFTIPKKIPVVVNGQEIFNSNLKAGFDPADLEQALYHTSLASHEDIDHSLQWAQEAKVQWKNVDPQKRLDILSNVIDLLRHHRDELIYNLIIDNGKTLKEADREVSDAIDYAAHAIHNIWKIAYAGDLYAQSIGITVVMPSWNSPLSTACNYIFSALAAKNPVIYKPPSKAVLSGYLLAKIFWEAGLPTNLLQLVPCDITVFYEKLLIDERVKIVALSRAPESARQMIKTRPDIHLIAQAGGKNSMIISELCDRRRAIEDLITSAFTYNGQYSFSVSLAICEKNLYEDADFLQELKEAAQSLTIGNQRNSSSKITPLISHPNEKLQRSLTRLEADEEWLLIPRQDPTIPNLWSPGIKLGVKKGSFSHQTVALGPVLNLMKADHLDHAITLANGTPYGLSSGLHTLDEQEKNQWQQSIITGNSFINRKMIDFSVQIQPFGGTKNSVFGQGFQAGGQQFITQFMQLIQKNIPKEKFPINERVNTLSGILDKFDLSNEDLTLWYTSVSNYAFWWKRLQYNRDPTKLLGEDNWLSFVSRKKMCLRIYHDDQPIDYLRVFAAVLTCDAPLQISFEKIKHQTFPPAVNWDPMLPQCSIFIEDEDCFLKRVQAGGMKRIRILRQPSKELLKIAAEKDCFIDASPPLATGRYELFHYLREMTTSSIYHRYGYLGIREDELRSSVH